MTEKEFADGLKLFKDTFPTSLMNLSNPMVIAMQYVRYKMIPSAEFKKLINAYCTSYHRFPANDIPTLMHYAEELFIASCPTKAELKEELRSIIAVTNFDDWDGSVREAVGKLPEILKRRVGAYALVRLSEMDVYDFSKAVDELYDIEIINKAGRKAELFYRGALALPLNREGKQIELKNEREKLR